MPTNPPPPTELHQLVDAYVNTGQAILDLGMTCREADFDKPTQCPGWTVKDHISHIAGEEHARLGHRDPDVEVPDYPWIKNRVGAHMERAVEVRRSRPGTEVVREWQQVLNVRQNQLRDPELDPEAEVTGPTGRPMRLRDLLELRVMDMWVHEQDLREALGRPGNLDSPGAALMTSQVLRRFPESVAEEAGLADGTTVIIESTGPVLARVGVNLQTVGGTQVGHPLFTGEDRLDEATGEVAPIKPDLITSIKLTTDQLTRRGAGRVPTSQLRYSVSGNEDVAAKVLDCIVITP